MADQQTYRPGGHYSGISHDPLRLFEEMTDVVIGQNKIPTVNKFLESLDKDKKGQYCNPIPPPTLLS